MYIYFRIYPWRSPLSWLSVRWISWRTRRNSAVSTSRASWTSRSGHCSSMWRCFPRCLLRNTPAPERDTLQWWSCAMRLDDLASLCGIYFWQWWDSMECISDNDVGVLNIFLTMVRQYRIYFWQRTDTMEYISGNGEMVWNIFLNDAMIFNILLAMVGWYGIYFWKSIDGMKYISGIWWDSMENNFDKGEMVRNIFLTMM